ncbi:Cornichon family protein [Melia azedarach]|uniref:Cornichon family protein n=1 Tax=Melia azedarach TaxID=155640 RepID=A0ACC1X5T5_MELAZ|nr:Cornichon family protein [Melia azedarach]
MAWICLFWFLMFAMNLALIVSSFYQLLCLVDLESDDLNPFEASYRINFWVVPEFLLQGLFCILLLVTGHWIIFLLAAPLACYHVNLYMKQQHLIDVTEVFRNLKVEKKFRIIKLGFYVIFFILVVFRLTLSGFEALAGTDENLLSF